MKRSGVGSRSNMKNCSIPLLAVLFSIVAVAGKVIKINPEVEMSLEQRIERQGYSAEAHKVITEDGYILTVYRIVSKYNESKNKSVVLFLHGMGGSPQNFISLGKHGSPSYYLVDKGLDVWLFSARGLAGSFKQKHLKYDWDNDDKYWAYSWHEIGVYDLTATIDLILDRTGQKKVSVIGHSAGGAEFLSMLSEKPEYNEKVNVAISWGSCPILKHTDYPLLNYLSLLEDFWKGLVKYLGTEELLPFLQIFKPMLRVMCADPDWQMVCIKLSWVIGSHKSVLQHPDDLQPMLNIVRLSSRIVLHFVDNLNTGTFRKYNFGPKKNMRLYGQAEPPHYNLSAVTAPIAFFLGPNDDFISIKDVYEAAELIPNVVKIYQIPFAKFTHLDFIFGRNTSQMLQEPVYRLIRDISDGIVPPPVNINNTRQ